MWSDCGLRVFSVAPSHQREPAGKTHASEQTGWLFCQVFLAASLPKICPSQIFIFPALAAFGQLLDLAPGAIPFRKLGVCSLPPLAHSGRQQRVRPSACKGTCHVHIVLPFLCLLQPGVLGYFEFNASPQPPGYLTFFASALHSLNKGE